MLSTHIIFEVYIYIYILGLVSNLFGRWEGRRRWRDRKLGREEQKQREHGGMTQSINED